jgi:hypothetical protein
MAFFLVDFRMETYGTSMVRLYNIAAKLYIAINKRGVVITEVCFHPDPVLERFRF